MGLFRQLVDTLPTLSLSTGILGSTQRFTLPRDFPREGFMITIVATLSGAAATIAPEGVFSLIKRVRLTANDGGQQRVIIDADGLSCIARHVHYNQSLDADTSTSIANAFGSTGAKTIRIPFFYSPSSIDSPARDLFLQNFPRFNNDPTLEIQFGAQADVDTNATPTFALSSLTVTIVEFKREVLVPNWNFLSTEFAQFAQSYPATVVNSRYQIPVPGYHFAIGLRPYTSATALGDNTTAGTTSRLNILNTIERNISLANIRAVNQYSEFADVLGATAIQTVTQSTYWLDYLTDQTGSSVTNLDTLLNTYPFTQLGTGPEIRQDITGGAGVQTVYTHDRVFGNISGALALRKLLAKS